MGPLPEPVLDDPLPEPPEDPPEDPPVLSPPGGGVGWFDPESLLVTPGELPPGLLVGWVVVVLPWLPFDARVALICARVSTTV